MALRRSTSTNANTSANSVNLALAISRSSSTSAAAGRYTSVRASIEAASRSLADAPRSISAVWRSRSASVRSLSGQASWIGRRLGGAVVLYDAQNDDVVAEGHTGPFWWSGADGTLPDGIDAAIQQVFGQHRGHESVNTLCALAAESRWRPRCPDPCRSPERSANGRAGRVSHSLSQVAASSPRAWPLFISTGQRTAGRTGRQTFG